MRRNANSLALSLAVAVVLAGCGGFTGPRTSTITGTVLDIDEFAVVGARVWTLDAQTVTSTAGAFVLDRTRAGEVKVTDFGLAKMNQAGLTKSMTQGVIGTLYYMSPEQIRGEEVDHRSDLWSLGVVFFEMLTGARPFDGPQEASVMYSILNEPAVFSEKHQNELPKEIQRIIGRALEKDREKRYSDATEMLVELESFESSSVNMTETRVMPGRARESGTTSRSRSSSSKTGQARTSSGESQGAGERRVLSVENKKPFIIAAGGALIVVVG
ncbi:MAG: protein kinase, partial [Armatimonadetes bacterium]|nr:protein kinase [Armatimonadota bacterium]